jgi:2-succinyl-5-enolpyruvyl-6-hydroxy-3-cyclohexene-1-carboxylate synthase
VPAPPVHRCSAADNLKAALTLLQALQSLGLQRLVLCPGSRSAPLAVAAGLLEPTGLHLITGMDERSAAFLALGLGRSDGCPTAVVTTSGSAVANLLPAVVEADHGAVPLLLLSADRPLRLKGCGANQTVNQEDFLAPCCRWFASGDPQGLAAMPSEALVALAQRAWREANGSPAGAVHLNLPFEEPLHPSAEQIETSSQAMAAAPPATAAPPPPVEVEVEAASRLSLNPDQPGAVVVGPWRGPASALKPCAQALLRWQRRSGWPVFADGLSGLRGWPGLQIVHGYDLLLADGHAMPAAPQLLRLGSMPASRSLQQWISACRGPQLLITEHDPRNLDATGTASQQLDCGLAAWVDSLEEVADFTGPDPNRLWLQQWLQADQQLQQQLDQQLPSSCCEPALARALSRLLPPGLPLMLASSSPVRDWESFAAADAPHRPVFGFRGASGIDGTLSVAAGLAMSHGEAVLLCGDLALLHDANGWLWHRQLAQRQARLTVVLVENSGGGIFEQLPIRAGGSLDFERLFAMPQSLDHTALAAGYGIASRRVSSLEQLPEAIAWASSQAMALIEMRTDRLADAALRQHCRRTMASSPVGSDGAKPLP